MSDEAGMKEWAQALEKLLQRAAAAKQADDVAQITAVQRALRKFKEDSPDFADALDTQATLAIFDLDLASTEDAVASIKSRAVELDRLTKLINGVSEEANRKAAVLNGTFAIQAMDAATAAIGSFRKLKGELSADQPDEKKIAAEIDKTIAAVQALRGKLEAS